MKNAVVVIAIALALSACQGEDPQAAAQAAAAQAAAKEQAAEDMARQFDAAVADGNWQLAKGHGDILQVEHPTSAAAARVKPKLDEIKAKAEEAQQQARLQALWAYGNEPVKGGAQISAAIYSQEPVDTDGGGSHPVRLIFRDHPDWGRSSYLVLQAGDFAKACYAGCKVEVTGDDGKAIALKAWRPKTDEAIAMFIEDDKRLWKLARANKALRVAFRTRDTGTKTAVFETGGVLPERMPGW